MTDFAALLNSPAFSPLSDVERLFYQNLAERLRGRTPAEAAILLAASLRDRPKASNLTPEQRNAMTQALLANLDEGTRRLLKP